MRRIPVICTTTIEIPLILQIQKSRTVFLYEPKEDCLYIISAGFQIRKTKLETGRLLTRFSKSIYIYSLKKLSARMIFNISRFADMSPDSVYPSDKIFKTHLYIPFQKNVTLGISKLECL